MAPNVQIGLSLQGGESLGGLLRFDPGGVIATQVQMAPAERVRARTVWLRLGWHTEGRATRDSFVAAQAAIHQGALDPATPINVRADLPVPPQPWSYAGQLINIVWEVEVVVDIPLSGDLVHRQPIIVAPRR